MTARRHDDTFPTQATYKLIPGFKRLLLTAEAKKRLHVLFNARVSSGRIIKPTDASDMGEKHARVVLKNRRFLNGLAVNGGTVTVRRLSCMGIAVFQL